MIFKSIAPQSELSQVIKEIWVYENHDSKPEKQKIIPDGFSEIIVHYGDPYRINMDGTWKKQSPLLFSNQISKYFFLENTGQSGMIGIKLFPWAFHQLFGTDLAAFTDRVSPLEEFPLIDFTPLKQLSNPDLSIDERENLINRYFLNHIGKANLKDTRMVEQATSLFFEKNGLIDIIASSTQLGISARQLERSFKKAIGVTPKFFSRIIRFNHVFQVMKDGKRSWVRVALESGFFDQSHFNKDFKEFTGEEPSTYGFGEETLANFFLKR